MDTGLLESLREFATGNTLVALYIAVVLTRYVLVPLYKSASLLRDFLEAATSALRDSASEHRAISAELRALNELLKSRDTIG